MLKYPYDRALSGETEKAFQVFCVHRDAGSKRKQTQTAQKCGIHDSAITRWKQQHFWTERLEYYDSKETPKAITQPYDRRSAFLQVKATNIALEKIHELIDTKGIEEIPGHLLRFLRDNNPHTLKTLTSDEEEAMLEFKEESLPEYLCEFITIIANTSPSEGVTKKMLLILEEEDEVEYV